MLNLEVNYEIKNIILYPVWIGSRNQLLVKVETDNGLEGWGSRFIIKGIAIIIQLTKIY